VDLLLRIDPTAADPLYVQLYADLRAAILDRTLSSGARLPSSRALAETLGLARNTVHGAYDQLIAEGYLETRHGSGTFVATSLPDDALQAAAGEADARAGSADPRRPRRRAVSAPHAAVAPDAADGVGLHHMAPSGTRVPDGAPMPAGMHQGRNGSAHGPTWSRQSIPPAGARVPAPPSGSLSALDPSAAVRLSAWGRRVADVPATPYSTPETPSVPFDFRHGRPDAGHFPLAAWRRVALHQLRTITRGDLWYGPPSGLPRLRAAIAGYIARARGVRCTPEQIIVTTGTQQALDLVARLTLDPGDAVAVEDPCYSGARRVFMALGARVQSIPVDEQGMRVAEVPETDVRLVYTTPSHQYPTGATLPLSRRLELLAWAERRRALVIEDDYDSEFRHVGRPLEAMQGLDRGGKVAYVGSFSKVLYPALRMGYLVVPPSLVHVASEAKRLADLQTATPPQEALAEFIDTGQFEAHLRRMRRVYRARRAALLGALDRELGNRIEVGPSEAGLYVLVRLPSGIDEATVARRAWDLGVAVYPAAPYYASPVARPGLVLGYAALDEQHIEEGIRRLALAARS